MKTFSIPAHLCPGGVVSTRVLRSVGYSYHDIRVLHLSGALPENLREGWWATSGADPEVVAAVRAGGVLTCVSALVRLGVYKPLGDDCLHVRASRGLVAGTAIKNCSAGRRPAPVVAVDHPLIAARAVIGCLDTENAVAVLDSMVDRHIVTGAELDDALGDTPRGRDLLRRRDLADSGQESLVRVRLRALGLKVRSQIHITGVGKVDLVVGDRLVVEVDFKAHHTRLENYRKDRRRDRALVAMGYRVMRITWEEVMFGWAEVEAQILEIVRRGDHRWPRRRT
ncbi:endonuclease domain-containing protein [Acidipropionibacterium virtanenii]|uniref:Restriction endonuclease type II-like domain-containing protein n=1 Tax=Acidipropionibacterium virtanenii TaxID=2057246 RepID=A0A344USA3_9ACTN|nr:DUF559 domain-containing protein [Acidipropionibacterium virtanenii]AXE38151.1 hypothetical protein JS278_00968 [Acidipropionibacterium virtanenii]